MQTAGQIEFASSQKYFAQRARPFNQAAVKQYRYEAVQL